MNPKEFSQLFIDLESQVKVEFGVRLPHEVGREAVSMYKKNFQNEGYFGVKWQEVNRRKTKTVRYKTKSGKIKTKTTTVGKGRYGKRKILTGATSMLGRSIRYKVSPPGKVIIFSDLKYSAAHNEGTSSAGRNRNVIIPKRQFMGKHPNIDSMVKQHIDNKMKGLFK